jgi:hypothetical protein
LAKPPVTKSSLDRAKDWLKRSIEMVKNGGNKLMAKDRPRLVPANEMSRRLIGRMVMFYYDPKFKDDKKVLPYYDAWPLVFPIKFYPNGFLGINLHYLNPQMRERLLAAIIAKYKGRHIDENRRLQMDYELLNSYAKFRFFKPCVKRYLTKHTRSKMFVVDPAEWPMVALLPTERFVRATKSKVWSDSKKSVGL